MPVVTRCRQQLQRGQFREQSGAHDPTCYLSLPMLPSCAVHAVPALLGSAQAAQVVALWLAAGDCTIQDCTQALWCSAPRGRIGGVQRQVNTEPNNLDGVLLAQTLYVSWAC